VAVDAVVLVVGIALLLGGAHAMVGGASKLAGALGVSELAIGLTVVAFGTSAPELAVNVLAALGGNSEIAFGNLVGSNIANVALVMALAATVRPLLIESVIVSREIPMMLLATAAGLLLGLDRIRGMPEAYDRSDGLILLLLFSVFLYYSISEVIAKRSRDPLAEAATDQMQSAESWAAGRAAFLAATGLGILLAGAQLTVSSAVALAEALEISSELIGFTVIAVGTSLPELVTCLVATSKGQTSLAVGTVVGSNIFNLLFILGVTAVIHPVEVPVAGGAIDLAALAVFSALLLPLSRSRGSRVVRREGAVLLAAYLAYLAWRLWG
jgi:cation:H+ antiporter